MDIKDLKRRVFRIEGDIKMDNTRNLEVILEMVISQFLSVDESIWVQKLQPRNEG